MFGFAGAAGSHVVLWVLTWLHEFWCFKYDIVNVEYDDVSLVLAVCFEILVKGHNGMQDLVKQTCLIFLSRPHCKAKECIEAELIGSCKQIRAKNISRFLSVARPPNDADPRHDGLTVRILEILSIFISVLSKRFVLTQILLFRL